MFKIFSFLRELKTRPMTLKKLKLTRSPAQSNWWKIYVRKTPDANSNNNISFICMTIWRYSIASFNIKLHTNDYNTMITMVNQVSSVWFDNKLLRKSFIMNNETNLNKSEFREKFCEFNNLINNSVEDSWLESTKLCWIWL